MSIKAYQRAATQAENPRELEYRAFGQVTASLVRAKETGAAHGALAEALDQVALQGQVVVLGSETAIKAANDERGGFLKVTKVL